MTGASPYENAMARLEEGYGLLTRFGFAPPAEAARDGVVRRVLTNLDGDENAAVIAAACQAFFVSRRLSDDGLWDAAAGDTAARRRARVGVVLGDYFVSLAVKLAFPIGDDASREPLTEMAALLRDEALSSARLTEALDERAFMNATDRLCKVYSDSRKGGDGE